MTTWADVHEAQTHLSRLIQDVTGECVVMTSGGREVARLLPPRPAWKFGVDRGRFVLPQDVDALRGDELRAFGA